MMKRYEVMGYCGEQPRQFWSRSRALAYADRRNARNAVVYAGDRWAQIGDGHGVVYRRKKSPCTYHESERITR